jgi:hypothetical protein
MSRVLRGLWFLVFPVCKSCDIVCNLYIFINKGNIAVAYQSRKEQMMQKLITCWVVVMVLSLFLVSSAAFAKGKGKGRGSDRPPGWDKGEKKGWDSDVPPGIEKKAPGLSKDKQVEKEDDTTSESEEQVRPKKKNR